MFIQLKNHKVHIFSKMEIDTSKKSILFIPGAGMDHRILSMFKMDSFCLLYTSPSPRDLDLSRMPSSA